MALDNQETTPSSSNPASHPFYTPSSHPSTTSPQITTTMAANNQETTPSEISSTDSDTSGGVPLDSESKAEHELRTMKIKYLQLEADLIRGEGELGGVHSVQGTSDKLTELKFMTALGLSSTLSSGFQSLETYFSKIITHYMSTVIPYNQLGLEIAILEGKEEEVDKCKMKIPRIEFEMQETVLKALEAGKRNILMLCEERTGELLGLAKDGGCV